MISEEQKEALAGYILDALEPTLKFGYIKSVAYALGIESGVFDLRRIDKHNMQVIVKPDDDVTVSFRISIEVLP